MKTLFLTRFNGQLLTKFEKPLTIKFLFHVYVQEIVFC
jgi:hypothetical protein